MKTSKILKTLRLGPENDGASTGLAWSKSRKRGSIVSYSPIDGQPVAAVYKASEEDYQWIMDGAVDAFKVWRLLPAPQRGEIIRQIAIKLRQYKEPLGHLVTIEMGKSLQEGLGRCRR
jgi:aldehyde dehydrogenase (NAD+)